VRTLEQVESLRGWLCEQKEDSNDK